MAIRHVHGHREGINTDATDEHFFGDLRVCVCVCMCGCVCVCAWCVCVGFVCACVRERERTGVWKREEVREGVYADAADERFFGNLCACVCVCVCVCMCVCVCVCLCVCVCVFVARVYV